MYMWYFSAKGLSLISPLEFLILEAVTCSYGELVGGDNGLSTCTYMNTFDYMMHLDPFQ